MVDYIVYKAFQSDGLALQRGTVIKGKDAKKWANLSLLLKADYLRVVGE